MFGEAIRAISEAEAAARAIRGEAVQRSKQMMEEATRAGEAKLRETKQGAEAECAEMMREAEAEATKEAQDLASNTKNKQAALRVRAEAAMSKARETIVGRIVNA